MNYELAVDTIKNSVSALDVANTLGLNVDTHGRCSCPFHAGKDRNLKLFPGNRGYSCFVCHESGDVIRFIRQYYCDMSFKDAISWFNSTFNLGLDIGKKIDPAEQKRAENALKMRKEAHELSEWKQQMQFKLFLLADQILEILEKQRDEFAPRTPDENWNQLFCNAIRTIPAAKMFAENCMMKCIKEK